MNSQHTSGPWKIIEGFRSGSPIGIKSVTRNVNVINSYGISRAGSNEGEANARLIAAAPDMLEALLITFKAFNDPEMDCSIECKDCEHEKTCPNVIVRKAIESATGQSIDNIMKEHNRCM